MATPQHVLTSSAETAELCSLSATELGRAYGAGELSPVEVLEAVLARCEAVNPLLNAVVALDRDAARQAAKASEARWRKGEALGGLDGVPLTVKDNIPVAGMRTTWGSRLLETHVPSQDELPVARLRAQGAVIVGKTNVPEFTLHGYTHNALFGTTRNPWDRRLTPGGSSGGAVAAVASGVGPVAIGTDGGGSIRRPAAHTGLVGLKPSPGRVARVHGLPAILHDFEVIGPIARTVADTALVFAAMRGPDPRDRSSLAFAAGGDLLPKEGSRLRILYVPQFGDAPVDPEIRTSVAQTARDLESLGHEVERGEAPFDLAQVDRIWSVIGPAGLAWFLQKQPDWRSLVQDSLRDIAEQGAALSAADYVQALDEIASLRARLALAFTRFDVVLTPCVAALPWPAEETHPSHIAGQPVGPRGHAVFTAAANAGGLPAISVPCRPSRSGLPIAIQLIGPYGGDEKLLGIAAQLERSHPWAERWPALQ